MRPPCQRPLVEQRLARPAELNYSATVGHDAVLDPFVTIYYPHANLSGSVLLGRGVAMGFEFAYALRAVAARTTPRGHGSVSHLRGSSMEDAGRHSRAVAAAHEAPPSSPALPPQ